MGAEVSRFGGWFLTTSTLSTNRSHDQSLESLEHT